MALVEISTFRLSADEPQFPIPANVNDDKHLYLVFDNLTAGLPQQHVRVVVRHNDGKVASDAEYPVGAAKEGDPLVTKGIPMPKGTNLATLLPGKDGPSDARIGFYLG